MNTLKQTIEPYWKAVAGFVTPGVGLLATDVLTSGHLPNHHQWLAIGVACVAGAVGVYVAPKNKEKP